MCQPSKVYSDWVVKGFHIHIERFELVLRPTYDGGIVFKRWPPHEAEDDATDALVSIAEEKCLPDAAVRRKWINDLERAMEFVRDERYADERLDALRNGRQYEFLRLIRALRRFDREES